MKSPPPRSQVVRDAVTLGRAIRDARKRRGWTQGELALQAAISQPTLSNIERGVGQASLASLWRLLAALGLDIVISARTRGDAAAAWDSR